MWISRITIINTEDYNEDYYFSWQIKRKILETSDSEYEKRLGAYSKIEMIEVPDEKAPETMSDKEIEQIKAKEGQRLLAKIKPQATVITLEIQGKMLSSEGLAKELQQRMTQGQSDFVFVIGDQTDSIKTS